MTRVLTIFIRHGTTKYAVAEDELDALFATQLPEVARDIVIVDTAMPATAEERRDGTVVLGSDNDGWEFSAMDRAIEFVGDRIWSYPLVNIATSAFRQLHVGYLEYFRPAALSAVRGQSVCLGHIDCYNEPIRVLGYVSQHWIRTSCFFIPPSELRLLGSLRSTGTRDRWFTGLATEPFRDSAPLSPNYRRLITEWLSGHDIGQGVTWHSRISVDREGIERFEQKTLAILNEHLLSARLRALACRLVDVTWLGSQLHRASSLVDWSTPWWIQLREREVDAVWVEPGPV